MAFVVMFVVADESTAHEITGAVAAERFNRPIKPVGIFRYPTKDECRCAGTCTNKNRMSPWRRDPRGWMKCAVCGHRHKDTRRRLIGALFDYLGANLMTTPPGAFRTPPNYPPLDG